MRKIYFFILMFLLRFPAFADGPTLSEVGVNDFQISHMLPDPSAAFQAQRPNIAYNSLNDEYLVVWYGDEGVNGLVDNENEIYAQRITASTGALVGSRIRVSHMGAADGDFHFSAVNPVVVYNSTDNEYLVVWYGDDDTSPLVDEENEIFAQRVQGATGALLGARLQISTPGAFATSDAYNPSVAYDFHLNRYLVAWQGDPEVDEEFEIYGQLVLGNGSLTGSNFRITHVGPDADPNRDALLAAVSYGSVSRQYLVLCQADVLANDLHEIYGQFINNDGSLVGGLFQVSDARSGTPGSLLTDALRPALAYNPDQNEFLVTWHANPQEITEYEIYGQLVDAATHAERGSDFRISHTGPDGDLNFDASTSRVSYDTYRHQYLVVWLADEASSETSDDENEIYAQSIDGATGTLVGSRVRVSDVGPALNNNFDATFPSLDFSSINHQFLIVWQADDTTDNDVEIFGQRFVSLFSLPEGGAGGGGSGGEAGVSGMGGESGSGGVSGVSGVGGGGAGGEAGVSGIAGTSVVIIGLDGIGGIAGTPTAGVSGEIGQAGQSGDSAESGAGGADLGRAGSSAGTFGEGVAGDGASGTNGEETGGTTGLNGSEGSAGSGNTAGESVLESGESNGSAGSDTGTGPSQSEESSQESSQHTGGGCSCRLD